MKKRAIGALILIFFAGCAGKNDILATYDGGSITRGEFFEWAALRGIQPETILDSKIKQESRLRMMLSERFAADEARKSGLDADPAVKTLLELSAMSLLSKLYIEETVIPASAITEPIRRVSHIFLRAQPFPSGADRKKNDEDLAAREKEVQQALASGMSFEACASKFSDDITRQKKGDAGYISYEMVPEPYAKAAFSLKKGEYTKESVRVKEGFYFIKVADIDAVTYSNAAKVIESPSSAQRIRAGIYAKAMKLYIEKLSAEKDQLFNEAAALKGSAADVVFEVGTKAVTAGDLTRFAECAVRTRSGALPTALPSEKKLKYARDIYTMELVGRDARRAGFDRNESFKRRLVFTQDLVLSRIMLGKVSAFTGSISEERIRSEYEKVKQAKFAVAQRNGMDVERKILPYLQVRESVFRALVSSEEVKLLDEWRNNSFGSRHAVVKKEKLEGR